MKRTLAKVAAVALTVSVLTIGSAQMSQARPHWCTGGPTPGITAEGQGHADCFGPPWWKAR